MNRPDLSTDQARLQSLLERAASLPAGERDVFLSRECGDDGALRQQIYDHLLAEARGEAKKKLSGKPGPVTSAVNQALEGSALDRRVELLGKVVGDYRLTAIIGAGGVGTVYLGERADRAYSAQVAIKVVANAQLSHEVQRRFAAEKQILAHLNHPYIARLLDAGETFFDEPFLVMEYVHGEPIDRYCNNQRLSVEERIGLFLKVCDAVQYAHRNLIVNRDLKPGNILVSKEGIPKLLDFGIAKLLDESAQVVLQEGGIAHTRVHDRLLTPEYASPEQIRGQPVTTASDVYSLGIILYELLTGVRPYVVNALNQLELERSICIQDPIKPSQMITALHTTALSTTALRTAALRKEVTTAHPIVKDTHLIPAARKSSFAKLTSQFKGDLDAIVMKALRKEPEHRYSSVEHLIEDLNRYLTQAPVEARQGNRWYITQRFIKRHTVGVISATAALLTLIAVAIILSIQAHQLKEQRDIATQQRDKLTLENSRADSFSKFMKEVLAAADPQQSQDKNITAKELLDKVVQKIFNDQTEQPEVQAQLLLDIGKAYSHQGQANLSIKYLGSSLHLQRSFAMENHLMLAITLNFLGRGYREIGNFKDAEDFMSQARNLLESQKLTETKEYLQTLLDSGNLEHQLSHLTAAKKYYKDSLSLSQRLYGENHPETTAATMQLAQVMIWDSNIDDAEKLIRKAINIYHATLPARHPDRILADLDFSDILLIKGEFPEALSIIKHGLDDQIAVYGNSSIRLLSTYDSLCKVQIDLGKLSNAIQSCNLS
ncbi:MAG: serine/threonine-protein kinase [Steroidobacter sp.]